MLTKIEYPDFIDMVKRAIKKQFHAVGHHLIAQPAAGFGALALTELSDILSRPIYASAKYQPRLQIVEGLIELGPIDIRQIPEIVWQSALCRDIQLVIYRGHVGSFGEFLAAIQKIHWEQILPQGAMVSVRCDAWHTKLFHETKLVTALEEHLTGFTFKPATKDQAEFHIKLYQHKNTLTVVASLAGKPLFKRGYRKSLSAKAPLAEHIAACLIHWHLRRNMPSVDNLDMILSSDSHTKVSLSLSEIYVPFAGSGTLGFEAITQLFGLMPCLGERGYAFERMSIFPEKTLEFVKTKLLKRQHSLQSSAFALDANKKLVVRFVEKDLCTYNGLCTDMASYSELFGKFVTDGQISLHAEHADFFKHTDSFKKPPENSGHILAWINPPYGIRLKHKSQSAKGYYLRIAQSLVAQLADTSTMSGVILLASDEAFYGFRQGIEASKRGRLGQSISFNQGGRHIRAIEFYLS